MKCKFCQEEMPERGYFCPFCGKDNRLDPGGEPAAGADCLADTVEKTLQQEGEAVVVAPQETVRGEAQSDAGETVGSSPRIRSMKRMAAISGCIATLALLATVLFLGISQGGWNVASWFDWLRPRENNVLYKDSYTVSDKKAFRKKDQVVAKLPGAELTNGQLQVYYWTQVYDFLNENSYYLTYMGLDYRSPLDEQNSYDGSGTWQQYFLDGALEMWHSNQAFALLAAENGFEMEKSYREKLDNMEQEMAADAKKNGYADVNAYLQDSMGPGCAIEDYIAYMESYYLGYSYFAELYNKISPTMEQIESYFTEHEDTLAESGVKKDGTYTVDVRHILIKIETIAKKDGADAQSDDTQASEDKYTEAQWEACQAEAQRILDEWLAGDKTEESFGELAKKYTEDTNGDEGGLYTNVEKGYMADTFDDWCFDESRVVGDYGLVKTKFGYHVIFFSGSEEVWITRTRSALLSEAAQKLVSDTLEKYPMEVEYKKIVLGEVSLG